MKTVLVAVMAVAVLGLGTMAFAGWGGPGYGHMGPGYGHMGYGYGPGAMMGYGWGSDSGDKKFLDETADLRREMHEKRFEYTEALRAGDEEKAEAISKELDTLYDKIAQKAPRGTRGRGYDRGGYGPMMGYGGPCW